MKAFLILLALLLAFGASACGGDDDDNDSGAVSDDDSTDDDTDDDTADDDADDDTGDDDTWPPLPDDDADDDTSPEYPESCADGPVFDFELEHPPFTVPFPNNLYTVADDSTSTGLRLRLNETTTRPIGLLAALGWIFDAANQIDGFSTLGEMYVPLWEEPDPDTLPDVHEPDLGDGVFVVVSDPGDPHDGEFAPVRVEWIRRSLRLTPWWPLREKTHYLLVATRALKPLAGDCYRASLSMTNAYFAEPEGKAYTDRYAGALARLEDWGLDPAAVLSISDFTTLDATGGLNAVRAELDDMADDEPPQFTDWSIQPISSPTVAAWGTATLSTPIFQDGDGVWRFDAQGRPIVDHWEDVEVLFTLPKADAWEGGQPYAGIVFGHGAISSKGSLKTATGAPFYAGDGFAAVGIDSVCHGSRAPNGGDEVSIALCYFNAFAPLHWRDNIRQSVSDHLWLIHALQNSDIDFVPLETEGDGVPDIDPDHLYFFGHSLGTIHGGVIAALAPQIEAHVMAMAGARYVSIGLETPVIEPFRDIIEQIEEVLPGVRVVDAAYAVGALLQTILDAGDPANYLPRMGDDALPGLEGLNPAVLQIGASDDATLGGESGGFFGRAGGWPQLDPFVWDADMPHAECPYEGSAFYQYDTDDHQLPFSGGELGDAARAQIAHFLETFRDTGTGEVIDPLAIP